MYVHCVGITRNGIRRNGEVKMTSTYLIEYIERRKSYTHTHSNIEPHSSDSGQTLASFLGLRPDFISQQWRKSDYIHPIPVTMGIQNPIPVTAGT